MNIKKKMAIAASIILLTCLYGGIYAVCNSDYLHKKVIIHADYQKSIVMWVQSTAEIGNYLFDRLEETAQKISTSEMYCLFANELASLDETALTAVQQAQTKVISPELRQKYPDILTLAEQLPLMNGVLRDFVQHSKLIDAYIVNDQGTPLLSASSTRPLINAVQKELTAQTLKANALSFAPLQKTPEGLILYYALPLKAEMSGNSPTRAVLLISKHVSNIVDSLLLNPTLPDPSCETLIVQQSGKELRIINRNFATPFPVLERDFDKSNLYFELRPGFLLLEDSYSTFIRIGNSPFWIGIEMPDRTIQDELDSLATQLVLFGLALALGITALAALLWWYIIGREYRVNDQKFKRLYGVIAKQKLMLDGINASLGMGLALINRVGDIRVANKAFEKIGNFKMLDGTNSLTSVFVDRIAAELLLHVQSLTFATEERNFEIEIPMEKDVILYYVTLYAYVIPGKEGNDGRIDGAVAIFQDSRRCYCLNNIHSIPLL